MICPPCQSAKHQDCPEIARNINLLGPGILAAPPLVDMALSTGQVCYCQHVSGSVLAASR
jgi:hypothetical protein